MTELDFVKQLKNEIKQQQDINSDSKKFIKNRKIKLCKFNQSTHKLTESDLPIESLLGCIFLIKGSNILEFYSWCDYNYSLYLEINKQQPIWIGKVSSINIEFKDPENIKYLLDGFDTFYIPSTWQYFILQWLQSGFQLYIHE